MSKLVVFAGSPRRNGIGSLLMDQVIAGATSVGAEVKVYHLNDKDIRGCQACYYCRSHEACSVKDGLQPMYEDIVSADGILATFPIYFHGISGQSKLWLDRLFPMMNSDFTPRHPGKKFLPIYTQGNPDKDKFKDSIEITNQAFNMFGWEFVDSLLITGTSLPQFELSQDVLERAFELGKKLS